MIDKKQRPIWTLLYVKVAFNFWILYDSRKSTIT
jgi:hypothetical protein